MKVSVVPHVGEINPLELRGKAVVVIDVLRATSVIVTALANGAKSVIPVIEIDEALELANRLGRENCILGGERNMTPIEGFDLGNSPQHYGADRVADKVVILTTTNGTLAIRCLGCREDVYISSFLNVCATVRTLIKLNKDVVVVCAGTAKQFSLDDAFCAGVILNKLRKNSYIILNDFAYALMKIASQTQSEHQDLLLQTRSFQNLSKVGYHADIEYCLQHDIFAIAPRLVDNEVRVVSYL